MKPNRATAKKQESAKLAEQTKAFLRAGGKIKNIKQGQTAAHGPSCSYESANDRAAAKRGQKRATQAQKAKRC